MTHYLMIKLKRDADPFKAFGKASTFISMPSTVKSIEFDPHYKPEEDEWMKVSGFLNKGYKNPLVCKANFPFVSANYSQIPSNRFHDIQYLCAIQNGDYLFQKVLPRQLLKKKTIAFDGEPKYQEEPRLLILNEHVDVLYRSSEDTLYFRDFAKAKFFFKGIEALYREATMQEVRDFLAESFIQLKNGYNHDAVGSLNRKRLASAKEKWDGLTKSKKDDLLAYIHSKSPNFKNLKTTGVTFDVENEDGLKELLWGIEERFYRADIEGEERLANSIIAV